MRIRADAVCGCLTLLDIARAKQHRETVGQKIFRDLKADSLIGAGDEGNGFI
jgi:hypothetical protein